jgi:uncharacterized protein
MRAVRAAAALLLLLAYSACSAGQPAAPDQLVIAAGGPEDAYRKLADALGQAAREAWSASVEVLPSRGPEDNLHLVADGRADVGFATVDVAASALSGEDPFEVALQIEALAHLYDDYLQVVTLASSDIEQVADLAQRRVSIGTSGTDIVANRVLAAAGVEPRERYDYGPVASAQALASGEIDAFFVASGLPTQVVSDLAGPAPIRLLSMPGVVEELQSQYGEYYQRGSIPAGTYGPEAEVATVTVGTVLVVRRDLPAEFAYRLTELLFDAKPELVAAHEGARRLDHRSAVATFPIGLHPGAQRYYRATKPLT